MSMADSEHAAYPAAKGYPNAPLRAVSLPGKAYELANVAAVEAGFLMEDSRGGLEPSASVFRGRFVCIPDRIARFGGDVFAMHEEPCHRQAHVVGLSSSDAHGSDVVAAAASFGRPRGQRQASKT
jgi:hypothetical protein